MAWLAGLAVKYSAFWCFLARAYFTAARMEKCVYPDVPMLLQQRHECRCAPLGDSQGTRDRCCSESAEARERRFALDKARKWRRLTSESAEE